jgi:hypothetical protein
VQQHAASFVAHSEASAGAKTLDAFALRRMAAGTLPG